MTSNLFAFASVLLCLLSRATLAAELPGTENLRPTNLFQFTKIWSVHLRFTPEQWDAMEPRQAERRFGGNRRGSFLQGPEGSRNGIAAAFGITFDYTRAELEFETASFKDV